MSLNNFIPEVWTAGVLRNLHNMLVFAGPNMVNRDYQGDIAQKGDTVRITAIGAVTVSSYTKNTAISAPQTLDDAQSTLVIDAQKYFHFLIDSVDRVQASANLMDAAMYEAGYAMAQSVDSYISNVMVTGAGTSCAIGSSASPVLIVSGTTNGASTVNAYEHLVNVGVKLSEQNTPTAGRTIAVPPWYHGMLLKDVRFTSYGTPDNRTTLENGRVGRAAGFEIVESNTVPNTAGTLWQVVATHPFATTFAEQLTEVEAYRSQDYFGDVVRGLNLFGGKVIRPANISISNVYPGT